MVQEIRNAVFFGKEYRAFLVSISLVIAVFVSGVFLGLYYRNGELIREEIITTARADFKDIALNRNWNEGHSGLYAEKKRTANLLEYLDNPEFESMNGIFYKRIGSTLMTGEIAILAPIDGMLLFHVTSLSPLDPKNLADEFEMDALLEFTDGKQEIYRKEVINDKTYFRYMAPLYIKNSCLQCHFQEGYRLGEIKGGISLSYNIEHIQAKLRKNTAVIVILALMTIVMVISIIYLLALKLMRRLSGLYDKVEKLAVTDGLTELYNRRFMNERLEMEIRRAIRYDHPLSCLMIDIDFFKKFNDNYGHPTGDIVLKEVASVIKGNCRTEDIVARYGGEEITVVAPETGIDGAYVLGERIRKSVSELQVKAANGDKVGVTISVGVSTLKPEGLSTDQRAVIVDLADRALYLAKANGRNRVETFKESATEPQSCSAKG